MALVNRESKTINTSGNIRSRQTFVEDFGEGWSVAIVNVEELHGYGSMTSWGDAAKI